MILPGLPIPISGTMPFDRSGSWENVDDGWTLIGQQFSTTVPRTGTYCLTDAGVSITATMTVRNIAGLKLGLSVWQRAPSGTPTRSIGYRFTGGATEYTFLDQIADTNAAYAKLKGVIDMGGNSMVEVRIFGESGSFFDDWRLVASADLELDDL